MILIGLLFLWCSSGVWWYPHQSSWPYFYLHFLCLSRGQTWGGWVFYIRLYMCDATMGCVDALYWALDFITFSLRWCVYNNHRETACYTVLVFVMRPWVVMIYWIRPTLWYCLPTGLVTAIPLGSKSKGAIQHMISKPWGFWNLIRLLFLWHSSGVWWYSQQSLGPYFTFPSHVCPEGKLGGIGFV